MENFEKASDYLTTEYLLGCSNANGEYADIERKTGDGKIFLQSKTFYRLLRTKVTVGTCGMNEIQLHGFTFSYLHCLYVEAKKLVINNINIKTDKGFLRLDGNGQITSALTCNVSILIVNGESATIKNRQLIGRKS